MIEFKILDDRAVVPTKGSPLAAGFDLVALEDYGFPPNTTYTIPLGFATAIPENLHGRIESRSGMAISGMVVLTGVIDADYRGEWKVILRNVTDGVQHVSAGQRIAQVVFRETPMVGFHEVKELSSTVRGAGGFGSTGR